VGYWDRILTDTVEQARIVQWLSGNCPLKRLDDWYRDITGRNSGFYSNTIVESIGSNVGNCLPCT